MQTKPGDMAEWGKCDSEKTCIIMLNIDKQMKKAALWFADTIIPSHESSHWSIINSLHQLKQWWCVTACYAVAKLFCVHYITRTTICKALIMSLYQHFYVSYEVLLIRDGVLFTIPPQQHWPSLCSAELVKSNLSYITSSASQVANFWCVFAGWTKHFW